MGGLVGYCCAGPSALGPLAISSCAGTFGVSATRRNRTCVEALVRLVAPKVSFLRKNAARALQFGSMSAA